jgi:murein L,D-transpeptidase YcbB/YkuD
MSSIRKLNLSLILLATAMAATPAAGQGFVERFFLGERAYRPAPSRVPGYYPPPPRMRQAAPEKPRARKVAKISGPSYYAYKTDVLKPVDFSPPTTGSIAAEESGAAPDGRFLEFVSGLDVLAEPEIGAALNQFYSEHGDFVWVDGERPNARAVEALRVLGEADRFGLEPGDYAVGLPGIEGLEGPALKRELARFEVALSARVLRYVSDARNGRVVADRLSGYHDLPRKELDLAGTLKAISHLKDVRTYLESRHPQNEYYLALRRELEMLRASPEEESVALDRNALIRPGESHPDLPAILGLIEREADEAFRERFGEILARHRDSEFYAQELAGLVKAAQQARGLSADGVIGPRTIAALAGDSRETKLERVLLALERLRWLPSDLGDPYVFINVPAFQVTFRENGRDRLSMRAVVGSKANQTYFFQDKVQQVDFHPYWGVPQSILVNEMLPRLQRDPSWLDRAGYEVYSSDGRRISSAAVNWWQFEGKVPLSVRQKPGPSNALGELKILFPNRHAIYMHDTPEKALFNRDMRAFSHGCVRLENPRAMAAAVLGWTEDQIAERLRRGHSSEKVTAEIPVYVAYFTAWPDESGAVRYHADVYERDRHLREAMDATTRSRQAGS